MKLLQELQERLELQEEIKDPIIAKIYQHMRKSYQKIVASPQSKYHPPLSALRQVYKQLSAPLLKGSKQEFIKVADKWPEGEEESNAYSDIMGRTLSSLGVEDVEDFQDSKTVFNALYKGAQNYEDDEEDETDS